MLVTIGATLVRRHLARPADLGVRIARAGRRAGVDAHHARIGLVPGTFETFRDVLRFRNAIEVPHVAHSALRRAALLCQRAALSRWCSSEVQHGARATRAVVLDFAAVNTLDSTALELVREMVKKLESRDQYNVRSDHGRCQGSGARQVRRGRLQHRSDRRYFHTTVRGSLLHLVEEGVVERDHSGARAEQRSIRCCAKC
jgi:hypothetical protein